MRGLIPTVPLATCTPDRARQPGASIWLFVTNRYRAVTVRVASMDQGAACVEVADDLATGHRSVRDSKTTPARY